jgi:hypothetical protein
MGVNVTCPTCVELAEVSTPLWSEGNLYCAEHRNHEPRDLSFEVAKKLMGTFLIVDKVNGTTRPLRDQ